MSELKCDRCGQDIRRGESWERDIHQVPFGPHESQYGANQIFGGFARHKGKCPTKQIKCDHCGNFVEGGVHIHSKLPHCTYYTPEKKHNEPNMTPETEESKWQSPIYYGKRASKEEQMSKLEQAKDAILDRIMERDALPNYVKILAEAYATLSESARMDKSFEYQTSHTPIDMLAKLKELAKDADRNDFDDMEEIA